MKKKSESGGGITIRTNYASVDVGLFGGWRSSPNLLRISENCCSCRSTTGSILYLSQAHTGHRTTSGMLDLPNHPTEPYSNITSNKAVLSNQSNKHTRPLHRVGLARDARMNSSPLFNAGSALFVYNDQSNIIHPPSFACDLRRCDNHVAPGSPTAGNISSFISEK